MLSGMAYEISIPALPQGVPESQRFPNLEAALGAIARQAHFLWLRYASGGEALPSGRRINMRSGAYAQSIQLRQLGPYAWEVMSDSPYASAIENGTQAYDQKKMLHSSWKVREVKSGPRKGKKYLIIPFRHGAPGANYNAMPAHIHDEAKQLAASRVTGHYQEPTVPEGYRIQSGDFRGNLLRDLRMTVQRNRYQWGGRLQSGLAPKMKPHHATDIYAGMVRMDNPGGGHSQFMTFRVMGEWSSGWQMPARPGYYPLKSVHDRISKVADQIVQAAIEKDLATHVVSQVRTLI